MEWKFEEKDVFCFLHFSFFNLQEKMIECILITWRRAFEIMESVKDSIENWNNDEKKNEEKKRWSIFLLSKNV